MLAVNAQLAAILASSVRSPAVFAIFQIPVVTNTALNTQDYSKLGAQYGVDEILHLRLTSILEQGANSCDISFPDDVGDKSPLDPASDYGRFFFPGAVDNKISVYIGLEQNNNITLEPKGIFISEVYGQDSQNGANTVTVNSLDQAMLFRGNVYAQFPPRMYGSQTGQFYNPNYALNNPSGDNKTFICDAKNWMSASNQAPMWGSDYVTVAVYVSNVAGGVTAVPNSGATAYTIDYINGKVTFTTAQTAGVTVSVDARPLSMAPEMMLMHLFSDFGAFDPSFMKFDATGIVLPIMEFARDRAIWDVATDIVSCINPRGFRWNLFFNEVGYLILSEMATDGAPVRVLTDEHDLLHWQPEYTSRSIANVVRASGTSVSNQPLTSISYDLVSINAFSQKPTFDIPSQFVATIAGMDTGSAMALLNLLTASYLFEAAYPQITAQVSIIPDPTLQVGDPITIVEQATGVNRDFYIKQIDDEISGPDYTQNLRIDELRKSQDFMLGLQQYAGAPQANNPNAIQAKTGLISAVSIAGTTVVSSGQPVVDGSYNPVIASWGGGSLPISITLNAIPAGVNTYIWRWMYLSEDAYTTAGLLTGLGPITNPYSGQGAAIADIIEALFGGFGTSTATAPCDVRTGTDTSVARRYWRPLLRCSDWLTNDGVTAYTNSSPVLNSTWALGPGTGNAGTAQLYGRLRVGVSDYDSVVSSGYTGQALYASGTPAATIIGAHSTSKYGVDFGLPVSINPFYGIRRKTTPCYLGILVANTQGVVQSKRIPFALVI